MTEVFFTSELMRLMLNTKTAGSEGKGAPPERRPFRCHGREARQQTKRDDNHRGRDEERALQDGHERVERVHQVPAQERKGDWARPTERTDIT